MNTRQDATFAVLSYNFLFVGCLRQDWHVDHVPASRGRRLFLAVAPLHLGTELNPLHLILVHPLQLTLVHLLCVRKLRLEWYGGVYLLLQQPQNTHEKRL